MLVHLTYWSTAVPDISDSQLEELKTKAIKFNEEHAITGCLLMFDGFFVQTVEGHADRINELYSKIMSNPMHSKLRLIQYHQITKRNFADWLFLSKLNKEQFREILLSYSSRVPFSFDDIASHSINMFINEIYLETKKN